MSLGLVVEQVEAAVREAWQGRTEGRVVVVAAGLIPA
jgi:hypothetical protein